MTAINHALTGSVIALMVRQPQLAVPLAIASHFVCDAIPHYGTSSTPTLRERWFAWLLLADATACFLLVAMFAVMQPEYWVLAIVCAFAAASPDFMWIKKFLRARAGKAETTRTNIVLWFHARIQWFERPIGAFVELAWAGAAVSVLAIFVL